MGQVVYGLDMFHISELTLDSTASVTFEDPEAIPGAVSVNVTPEQNKNSFKADNSTYAVLSSLGDVTVEMEAADLPMATKAKLYGRTSEQGVQFGSKDDQPTELALGFRMKKSTGGYRYVWLLKGTPSLMPIEGKTDDGSGTPTTSKVSITFMPLQHNGRWIAEAEDGTEFTQGDAWFTQVVYEGAALPPVV